MNPTTKKRRWLPRISLRTLLILVTLFSIWIGWYAQRAEKQRRAVVWIVENGGTVEYDYQFDSTMTTIVDARPPGPKWLRDFLGVDFFSNVTQVRLRNESIRDISPIAGLKRLWSLDLRDTQVSDLTPLSGLTDIEYLWLDKTQISDLEPLAGMTKLVTLCVNRTQVDDLTPLQGLAKLKWLDFRGTQVKDLSPLEHLGTLKYLHVGGQEIGDLAPIAGLDLWHLDIRNVTVNDLGPIAAMETLDRLVLWDTQISDMTSLSELPGLKELIVSGTVPADFSLLVELSNLTYLSFRKGDFTDDEIKKIRSALPKCKINVRDILEIGRW